MNRVAGSEGSLDSMPALGRGLESINEQMFWTVQSSERAKRAYGSDTFIGFVNAKLHPTSPRDRVIYADLLCSIGHCDNCHLKWMF